MARRNSLPSTKASLAAIGLPHDAADLTHPETLRYATSRVAGRLLATAQQLMQLAEEGLQSGSLEPREVSQLVMAASNAVKTGVAAARDAAVLASKLGGVLDAKPVDDGLPEDPLKQLPEDSV